MAKKVDSSIKSVTHKTIGKSDDAKINVTDNKVKSSGYNATEKVDKAFNKLPSNDKSAEETFDNLKEAEPKSKRPKQQLTKNQEELAKVAKAANRKLVALSKKGLSTPAQRQAKEWLAKNTNRSRFSTNPAKLNSDQVEQELYNAKKFINAKTSTATGYKDVIKRRNATFERKGYKKEDLDKVYNFLAGSVYAKMLKKLPSDEILDLYKDEKTKGILETSEFNDLTNEQKNIINEFFNNREIFRVDDSNQEQNQEQSSLQDQAQGKEWNGEYTVENVVFKK